MKIRFAFRIGLLVLAFGIFPARANVTPNPLFADYAVLQQGMKMPVWGTTVPDMPVTVEFDGQSVSTTADAAGKWLFHLAPMKAGGPHTLTISGKNKIALTTFWSAKSGYVAGNPTWNCIWARWTTTTRPG